MQHGGAAHPHAPVGVQAGQRHDGVGRRGAARPGHVGGVLTSVPATLAARSRTVRRTAPPRIAIAPLSLSIAGSAQPLLVPLPPLDVTLVLDVAASHALTQLLALALQL